LPNGKAREITETIGSILTVLWNVLVDLTNREARSIMQKGGSRVFDAVLRWRTLFHRRVPLSHPPIPKWQLTR
jgi:hypothetical protein